MKDLSIHLNKEKDQTEITHIIIIVSIEYVCNILSKLNYGNLDKHVFCNLQIYEKYIKLNNI